MADVSSDDSCSEQTDTVKAENNREKTQTTADVSSDDSCSEQTDTVRAENNTEKTLTMADISPDDSCSEQTATVRTKNNMEKTQTMADASSDDSCSEQADTVKAENNMEKTQTTADVSSDDSCSEQTATVRTKNNTEKTQTMADASSDDSCSEQTDTVKAENNMEKTLTMADISPDYSCSEQTDKVRAENNTEKTQTTADVSSDDSCSEQTAGVRAEKNTQKTLTMEDVFPDDSCSKQTDTVKAENNTEKTQTMADVSSDDSCSEQTVTVSAENNTENNIEETSKLVYDKDKFKHCEKMKVNSGEINATMEIKIDSQHRNVFMEGKVLNEIQQEEKNVIPDDPVDGNLMGTANTQSEETSITVDSAECIVDSLIADMQEPSIANTESKMGNSEKDTGESDTNLMFEADVHKLTAMPDPALADNEHALKDDNHCNSMMNVEKAQRKTIKNATRNMDENVKDGYFLKVTVQNTDYETSGSYGDISTLGESSDDDDADCSASESDRSYSIGSLNIGFLADETEEKYHDYDIISRRLKCRKSDGANLFILGRKENEPLEMALTENFVIHSPEERSKCNKFSKYRNKRQKRKHPVLLTALRDLSDSHAAIFSNTDVHVSLPHFQRDKKFNKKWQCKTKNRYHAKLKNNEINCPLCHRNRVPGHLCEECYVFGCKSCISNLHSSLTSLSDHVIRSVDFRFHCRCHKDLYKYFCTICEVPLCEKKMLGKHREHSVQTLADYISEQREHLEKSSKHISKYCLNKTDLCLSEVEQQKENLELSWIREKEVVQLEFASLRDMLVEQENAVLSEMEKGFQCSKERLKTTTCVLGDVIQQEAKLTSQTLSLMSDPSKYNFLLNGKHIKDKWSKLKDYTQALPCLCNTSLEPFTKKLPISLYKEKCELYSYLRAYIHDLGTAASEADGEMSDPCSETFKLLTQNDLFTQDKQACEVKRSFDVVKPEKWNRRDHEKDSKNIHRKSYPCKLTPKTMKDTEKGKIDNIGDKNVSTTKVEPTLKFSKLRIQSIFRTAAIDTPTPGSKICSTVPSGGTPTMTSAGTHTVPSAGTPAMPSGGTPTVTSASIPTVTSAGTPTVISAGSSATPTMPSVGAPAMTLTGTPVRTSAAATPTLNLAGTSKSGIKIIPATTSLSAGEVNYSPPKLLTNTSAPSLNSSSATTTKSASPVFATSEPTTTKLKFSTGTLSSIAASVKFYSENISKNVTSSSSKVKPTAKKCELTFSSIRSSVSALPLVKCSVKTTSSGSITQAETLNFGSYFTRASSSSSSGSVSKAEAFTFGPVLTKASSSSSSRSGSVMKAETFTFGPVLTRASSSSSSRSGGVAKAETFNFGPVLTRASSSSSSGSVTQAKTFNVRPTLTRASLSSSSGSVTQAKTFVRPTLTRASLSSSSGSVTQAATFKFGPELTRAPTSKSVFTFFATKSEASAVTVPSTKCLGQRDSDITALAARLNLWSAPQTVETPAEPKPAFQFSASSTTPSNMGLKLQTETTVGNTATLISSLRLKVNTLTLRTQNLCKIQQASSISLAAFNTSDTCGTGFGSNSTVLKPSYSSLKVRPLKQIVISDCKKPLRTSDLWNPPSGALSKMAHWEYSFEVRDGTKNVLWSTPIKFRDRDFVLNSASLFKLQSPNSYVLKVLPHYVVESSTSQEITTGKPTLILLFTNQQSMDWSELLPTEFHTTENCRLRSLHFGKEMSYEEQRFRFYLNETIHQPATENQKSKTKRAVRKIRR